MSGHLYIIPGDVSQLSADVLVYSTDMYGRPGHMHEAFCRHIPGFEAAYAQARQDAGLTDHRRRLSAGETFWVPFLRGASVKKWELQGVAVVCVIERDLPHETLNQKIVTAAIDEAARHLRSNPDGKRWLVAIPGLRMGAALAFRQGMAERGQAAQAQVKAAREALTARDDLDVAFVAYTPDIYHLYEQARRAAGGLEVASGMTMPPPLTQAIRDGECVLFVGSGLSAGAGLPGWQVLVGKLAAELGLPQAAQGTTDYALDVAELYRQERGSERLAALIRAEFGGTRAKPTLAHYLLMGMGIRHVITTNYDSLLERTLTALRRDPVKVLKEADVARTGETGTHFVVKFHGDAEQSDDGIVLSRADYENFFEDHPAMTALLEGLLLNQTFLFVGYSLSDPNFRQIYSRIARILKASKRMAYAIQFDADASDLTRKAWASRKLQIVGVPGNSEERDRHFLRFLDGLAAAVLDEPKLFVGARTGLRDVLASLGREVNLAASQDNLNAEEVRQLASTLTFLTRHGWRPSVKVSAWKTWGRLAAQSNDDLGQKRMMLREALKHTERLKDADKIRVELEAVHEELKRMADSK